MGHDERKRMDGLEGICMEESERNVTNREGTDIMREKEDRLK